MYQLVLASESPRRKNLLEKAGFSFEVIPSKVSEFPNKNLNINEQILDIARRKSSEVYNQLKSQGKSEFLILAADTEVIYDHRPLGKPSCAEEATQMLTMLSGQQHEVKTAVILKKDSGEEISHLETSIVKFKKLSQTEIAEYVATGKPLDKAGGYGIQDEGKKFVQEILGSFNNVVGLPIEVVEKLMKENNLVVK